MIPRQRTSVASSHSSNRENRPTPAELQRSHSIFVPTIEPITKVTRRLVYFTIVASITGQDYIAHGSNFLEPYAKNFANTSWATHHHELSARGLDWLWSITNATRIVAALFGFLLLPASMQFIGRRYTGMLFSNLLLLCSIFLMFISPLVDRFELYILSQFFQGLGSSFVPALTLFMAESVPDRFRGITSMFPNCGTYFSIALAALVSTAGAFGNVKLWPYFPLVTHCDVKCCDLAVPLTLPQMLTCRYFPASPKFLYLVRKSRPRALQSIRFYHGSKANADAVIHAYDREAELSMASKTTNLSDIWHTRHLRIAFLICLVANIAPNTSGNTIKGSYLNSLFISFGVPQDKSMIPITFIYFTAAVVGAFSSLTMVEKLGRRQLLLGSMLFDCLGILCMVIADSTSPSNLSSLMGFASAMILTLSLVIGLERLPVLLIAELMPQGARAITASVSFLVGTSIQLIQSLTYPPTHPYLMQWSWIILLICEFTCFFILLLFLPETQGRTVEEIVAPWVDKKQIDLAQEPPVAVPRSDTVEERYEESLFQQPSEDDRILDIMVRSQGQNSDAYGSTRHLIDE